MMIEGLEFKAHSRSCGSPDVFEALKHSGFSDFGEDEHKVFQEGDSVASPVRARL